MARSIRQRGERCNQGCRYRRTTPGPHGIRDEATWSRVSVAVSGWYRWVRLLR